MIQFALYNKQHAAYENIYVSSHSNHLWTVYKSNIPIHRMPKFFDVTLDDAWLIYNVTMHEHNRTIYKNYKEDLVYLKLKYRHG